MNLNSLKVLITGGASGIGFGLSESLYKYGAEVIVLDLDNEKIKNLRLKYEGIKFFTCDITDFDKLDSCLDSIFNSVGIPDVLVNNAGIMTNSPLIDLFNKKDKRHSYELWKKTLDVNLNSAFYLTSCIVEKNDQQ